MRTRQINKDDKLCFALDYLPVEKKYKKTKKIRNIVNYLTILASGVSLGLGFVSLPSAITVAILSGMVLLPSMYIFNSKMREVIDTVNRTNITFRQFKKMERSGELDKLLIQAKQFQSISPSYVGIEKLINTDNSINKQKTLNKRQIKLNTKNCGRDA